MGAQNLVSQNLFSMFLSSEVSQPGELIFGGFCAGTTSSSFFFTPIVEKEWYVVKNEKITVNGDTVSGGFLGEKGIVDSGTSLFIVPPAAASKINEKVSGNSNYPDIVVGFSNGKITLSPDQYIVKLQNQGQTECILGIQGATLGPFSSIFGDVVMRAAKCVAFDRANSQIGFAI